MKGTILVYRPGTTIPEVREIDGSPTLDVLKAGIGGGHIEIVPYFNTIQHGKKQHRCVAFCDENGKLTGLPMNMPATKLWDNAMRKAVGCGASPDFLVGDIAVVFGDEAFMEAL
jgi:hypothetical protein